MPTVLRLGGLRVAIYPNDHRPAHAHAHVHVHVIGQGHEAVFELNRPAGAVTLRENYGFSRNDLAAVARSLIQNLAELLRVWERWHGIA